MTKRAAIYIRVSTELQAERASPEEQEKDCRTLCRERGYVVAHVYRDTERYRVGKRLVEPSGTRADRPQYRQMLADAVARKIDVIVAWREDRLYRSYRAMLDLLDCIEQHKIEVELVKEHFDATIAPVKAWAARMELKAKSERTAMGRAARLASNKPHKSFVAYGYTCVEDGVEVNQEEAAVVQQIYTWYAAGVPVGEIRRRLVEQGTPQRRATTFGKGKRPIPWAKGVIQKMLTNPAYSIGKQSVRCGERVFELSMPVLIEPETARLAAERRQKNKSHPVRNLKHTYLVAGVAYCQACDVKLGAKARKRKYRTHLAYRCTYHDAGYVRGADSGCCRTISAERLEAMAWEKIWAMLSNDQLFERRVQEKVIALEKEEKDAEAAVTHLEAALDDIMVQRQTVMNWALRKKITEADMETKLAALAAEEHSLRRELEDRSLLIGNRAQKLLGFMHRYRARLAKGRAFLNYKPPTPEAAEEQFAFRREIVDAIVTRVEVGPDKTPTVHFVFDLSKMPQNAVDLDNSQLREFVSPMQNIFTDLDLTKFYLTA